MEVPIAGSLRPSPDVAETLRKSHRVSRLVGAVVGALHPPTGAKIGGAFISTFVLCEVALR
jgi:hypothetical protein